MADNPGSVSDGHHTFDELYEHRHALFVALCRERCEAAHENRAESDVWRSRLHADGTMFAGWFVMGIHKQPGRQISYHLPERLWRETGFAETLARAPEWDGHSSADVVARLGRL